MKARSHTTSRPQPIAYHPSPRHELDESHSPEYIAHANRSGKEWHFMLACFHKKVGERHCRNSAQQACVTPSDRTYFERHRTKIPYCWRNLLQPFVQRFDM